MRTSPTFDPHLDIATVVFSHVQCVKTRVNLALVSKLWRDASKPAAAYPLRFDFDAFPDMLTWMRSTVIIRLLDNDEALSLPYERVVGLLGEDCEATYATTLLPGECKTAEVGAREQPCLECGHVLHAQPHNGHLPALQYLHENGCPWDSNTCMTPPITNTGTACSTRWITSARSGRIRQGIREAPPIDVMTHNRRLRSCFICYLDILISIDSFTLNDPRARTRP